MNKISSKRKEVRSKILQCKLENGKKFYNLNANEVKTSRWSIKRTINKFLETHSIKETSEKSFEKRTL